MMRLLKYNTGADPGELKGFHGTSLFASDRPLINCYICKLKSVYYHRFYNKTLTFTSFYCKIIENYSMSSCTSDTYTNKSTVGPQLSKL